MRDPETVVTVEMWKSGFQSTESAVEIEYIHKTGCNVAGLAETSAGFS